MITTELFNQVTLQIQSSWNHFLRIHHSSAILDHSDQDVATVRNGYKSGTTSPIAQGYGANRHRRRGTRSKPRYLQDAIEEYELTQQRLKFIEGPDETSKHQDMVEAQRKSMLSIKKAVQCKIKACHLAVEIEVALADMRKVMKSTSFTSTNAQTRVKRVESTCTELSHKYVPLRGDA